MSKKGYVPLRERAIRAWKEERPSRAAQLRKRVNLTLELREKLEEVLGVGLTMKIVTDLQDRPIAMIEELRFTLTNHLVDCPKDLVLIGICSRCEAETAFIIKTLADLGQLFECFGMSENLGCTECIGLTNDDLKPSAINTVKS